VLPHGYGLLDIYTVPKYNVTIKSKVLLPQAYVHFTGVGYPVYAL
jgi:hypothetical protein